MFFTNNISAVVHSSKNEYTIYSTSVKESKKLSPLFRFWDENLLIPIILIKVKKRIVNIIKLIKLIREKRIKDLLFILFAKNKNIMVDTKELERLKTK